MSPRSRPLPPHVVRKVETTPGPIAAVPTARVDALLEGLDPLLRAGLTGPDAGPPGMGPAPTRVHEPGGDLVRQLLDPNAFTVLEREYRKLPEEGMMSPRRSPKKPFQFTLGSYQVPRGMHLWLSDYTMGVLLFDGINPGDFELAEEGRFSGTLGFDVTVDASRTGNIQYELDPTPIDSARTEFRSQATPGRRAPADAFDRAAANSFAATSSQGLSLLPVRRAVQGPQNRNPWTWIVQEGQTVALRCVIFRRLLTPVAGFFGRLAGHQLQATTSQALIQRMRPA